MLKTRKSVARTPLWTPASSKPDGYLIPDCCRRIPLRRLPYYPKLLLRQGQALAALGCHREAQVIAV